MEIFTDRVRDCLQKFCYLIHYWRKNERYLNLPLTVYEKKLLFKIYILLIPNVVKKRKDK